MIGDLGQITHEVVTVEGIEIATAGDLDHLRHPAVSIVAGFFDLALGVGRNGCPWIVAIAVRNRARCER